MMAKQAVYFQHCCRYLDHPDHLYLREWRRVICDWFYKVVDHVQADRSVVFVAMNFLDRYMSCTITPDCLQPLPRSEFYLAAMTCLTLASKIEIVNSRYMQEHIYVSRVVKLAGGNFTKQDVESKEHEILSTLNWLVHPPVHSHFIQEFTQLLPRWKDDSFWRRSIFEHARFATELALAHGDTPDSDPALTAYCCMLSYVRRKCSDIPDVCLNAFCANVSRVLGIDPVVILEKTGQLVAFLREVQ